MAKDKKHTLNEAELEDHPGEDLYIDEKHEDAAFLEKQETFIINNNPRNGEGPRTGQ